MAFLDQAVEDLYVAFADVPVPDHLDGCPCCFDDVDYRALLATERRQLSPESLSRYAFKAISTVGTTADYLYFFPRIIELQVADPGWGPALEIVFGKIGDTDPATWPGRRREGLETFLLAALEGSSRYAQDRSNFFITDLVCAVGCSGLDLEPLLQAMLAYPSLVTDYVEGDTDAGHPGELRNAFWAKRVADPRKRGATGPTEARRARNLAAQDRVLDWLQSDGVVAILTDPATT